ncbi:MAG: N-acetylmuramoyl-L-alanine amidase, partial [Salaquimonas sp.]
KNLAHQEGSSRYDLEILLKPTSHEVFAAQISAQQALLGSSGEAVVKGDRVRAGPRKEGHFSIVIDPGHGGIDGGSVGHETKVLEKDLTLKISNLIGEQIEGIGPFEVSYTRTEDVFVSLKERQQFALRQNADLMISIHADSLKQLFVRGATVYTLAKRATDALSQSIADSENLADVVAGLAAPEAQDDVTDILADLTLRETTRFSRSFSSLLVENMRQEVKMIKNPQRAASFAVLKNAEVPSVLIELGYLSNSEDEKLLSNDKWQAKAADLIARAVQQFFVNRTPHSQPD